MDSLDLKKDYFGASRVVDELRENSVKAPFEWGKVLSEERKYTKMIN